MSENNLSLRLFLALIRLVRGVPALHRLTWRIRKNYNRAKRFLWVHRPVVDGGPLLRQAILNATPYAAGKIGSIEAASLDVYLKREKARALSQNPPPYSPYLLHSLHLNAGVFPQDAHFYDIFSKHFLHAVSQCDMLVAWDVAGEAEILRSYGKQAVLIPFPSLEPFSSSAPWTQALQGKRVLVISPFIDSIKSQYTNRNNLWDDPTILPAFELLTLRAPFSAGLIQPVDADWNAALEWLQREMDQIDYDVALIGAGAFSLPLCLHAKKQKKIGVHLGGMLQFLFGVYGNRWEKDKNYNMWIKPSWVRPSRAETPQAAHKTEDGCYW